MGNVSVSTRAIDFYKLPKEEFIERYGAYEHMVHGDGSELIRELLYKGKRPSTYRVRNVMHCTNDYAKEFVAVTLEIMKRKGII